MSKCMACRDHGLLGGCPVCGKTLKLESDIINDVPDEVLEINAVPDYYKHRIWSKDTFLQSHVNSKSQALLEKYAEQLTRIYNIFSSGKIPDKSFFVIAPKAMGKLTWAYACMQEAMKHGHSVVPIIDNTQYKRLSILSSDRMNSKYLKNLNYTIDDYNTADVMFFTVDPDNFQTSYRTIESVLSKRARAGKATFVISRYTLDQMSLADYTQTFSSNIQANTLQDKNKYCVIIGG